MLSKEVKDILEGIHFFLTDGLKDESLGGKVECIRRGLLLQLEGLRTTYPFLQFSSNAETNANIRQTSTSLPYLHVEQQNVNSYRMSTSSTSSTNYSSTGGSTESSTGYSGDGVVTVQNQNAALIAEKSKNAKEFEEFEEIENCSNLTMTTTASTLTTQSRRGSSDFSRKDASEDRDDESYAEDIDPVSFRILVGKCDYHGVLQKRSRGLLPGMRNSKSFRCVLAGPLLYLYLKESDDKQKKVIDLNGYRVQEAPMDDHKLNSRRKDFAFQLVAPGKKTHIFFTLKKTSTERWITCIKRAILDCEPACNGETHQNKSALTRVEEDTPQDFNSEQEDDYDEEFYEELIPEGEPKAFSPKNQSSGWKPSLPPYHTSSSQNTSDDTSEYYSVPEESDTPSASNFSFFNERNQQRIPPERPPLPEILRQKSSQGSRPLPEAPEVECKTPEDDDEIYCEIDDAVSNTASLKDDDASGNEFQETISEYLIHSTSLSKEIFDTINERVPSLPARSRTSRWDRMSCRSDTSSTEAENYDVPSDVTTIRSVPSLKGTTAPPNIPFLPPKGRTPLEPQSDEESDYKVPSSTAYTENLYQVPARIPVPVAWMTDCQKQPDGGVKEDANGDPEEVADGELSDTINNNDGATEEHLSEVADQGGKSELNGDSEVEKDANLAEVNPPAAVSESKPGEKTLKKLSSSLVKEMIAKLNQNDELMETSHPQICSNSNFRRSELSKSISFEKSSLVENKDNKIEVSKSVKEIKSDLENKEKQNIKFKDIKNCDVKFKDDRFYVPAKSEAPSVNGNSKEGVYENFESERDDSKPAQDCPAVYIAKFAFVSSKPGELSFSRGDEILVKENPGDERMWKGVIKGCEGLVLREYLRRKT